MTTTLDDRAAPTLCTSGYNCTMPKPGEIDCTLLAP